ncbi:MAG: MarR family winged helix-turn-helix transcriptional regulator [Gemmataceae bacterium]|nr:MarR family winged helix-turn-helix transcriptional regulator [Gemmataceae bacterium]
MVATGPGVRLEEVAREVFEVLTQLGLTVPPRRRRAGDLKEIEFLTLSLLQGRGTMIVGDIQRVLGVLPAQMSRIIRALEDRDRPMIVCHINSRDKRKVDVRMTAAGEKALAEYQAARVVRITESLRGLPEELQEEVGRLLDKLREHRSALRGDDSPIRSPGSPVQA